MGRHAKDLTTLQLKLFLPNELREIAESEFEKFRKQKESEGLKVTSTDFINSILVSHFKEIKEKNVVLESTGSSI